MSNPFPRGHRARADARTNSTLIPTVAEEAPESKPTRDRSASMSHLRIERVCSPPRGLQRMHHRQRLGRVEARPDATVLRELDPATWRKRACKIAGRNLTASEA